MIETVAETVQQSVDDPGGLAAANFAGNLDAIRQHQPGLSDQLDIAAPGLEWIFARDGSLTAMEPGERWWGGCSLPTRASRFMLKTMSIHDPVACFLHPTHAAQLKTALEMLRREQAVIALQPDVRTLAVMLRCEGFAADIRSQRLWFVTGDQWSRELSKLLAENPGLPTPTQFIRPILADATPADALIGPAQKVFAEVNAARSQDIQWLAAGWKSRVRTARQWCVIAKSRFRLWDDSPHALWNLYDQASAAGTIQARRFDPDAVGNASTVALAKVASESDAVISANLSRAEIQVATAPDMPWITWVTRPHIPAASNAGPRDRLILADPAWQSIAQLAGWSPDRMSIATWPGVGSEALPIGGSISLVADTIPLSMPHRVREYSSHGLLWELIEQELSANPSLIGNDLDAYLDKRMRRLQIAESGFDRQMFIDQLIVPTFQQGIAATLVSAGVPVRLFGRGWDEIPGFTAHGAGAVASRERFEQVIGESAILIHAWPAQSAHPIEACGRPVVRAFGKGRNELLRALEGALKQPAQRRPNDGVRPLSIDQLLSLI